jgi:hypothetical protein
VRVVILVVVVSGAEYAGVGLPVDQEQRDEEGDEQNGPYYQAREERFSHWPALGGGGLGRRHYEGHRGFGGVRCSGGECCVYRRVDAVTRCQRQGIIYPRSRGARRYVAQMRSEVLNRAFARVIDAPESTSQCFLSKSHTTVKVCLFSLCGFTTSSRDEFFTSALT